MNHESDRTDSSSAELSPGDELDLWRLFRSGRDKRTRLLLVDYYTPLARGVATRLYAGRPDPGLEFGDYLQWAMIGLLEAVDRYDPERGAAFRTYARYRVEGAVLNGVPRLSERGGQAAARRRRIGERINSLADAAAGDRDEFEVLAELTVGLALGFILGETGVGSPPADAGGDQMYGGQVMTELRAHLVAAVAGLPQREQTLIRFHYFHAVGFEELAGLMGLSKGRVSQLHRRALTRLRESLHPDARLDDYF